MRERYGTRPLAGRTGCFLATSKPGPARPFCLPSWPGPNVIGLSHGPTSVNSSYACMPTIRISMRCCPIAGLPIIPSRSCRIVWTNLVRRRLASANDGNDDARCSGESSVRAHPRSSWITSARALQFKKQYVLAGRLPKVEVFGDAAFGRQRPRSTAELRDAPAVKCRELVLRPRGGETASQRLVSSFNNRDPECSAAVKIRLVNAYHRSRFRDPRLLRSLLAPFASRRN